MSSYFVDLKNGIPFETGVGFPNIFSALFRMTFQAIFKLQWIVNFVLFYFCLHQTTNSIIFSSYIWIVWILQVARWLANITFNCHLVLYADQAAAVYSCPISDCEAANATDLI